MTSGDATDPSRVRAPEKRDVSADERDAIADERDVVASARDALADAREDRLDAWERQLEARAELWLPAGMQTGGHRAERRDTLLAATFAGIAEHLHQAATADALLTRIAEAALVTILGATTATVTSDDPHPQHGEEPSVPAEDPAAAGGGWVMSFPFRISDAAEDGAATASLNVYAATPDVLDKTAREIGFILAAHASLAARELGERIRLEAVGRQLEQALSSRDVIGQAKGILMERLRTTPEDAFAILTHASQRLNVKLREVAATLTESGEVDARDLPKRPHA